MIVLYDKNVSQGYMEHVKEIRNYSSLVCSMLGVQLPDNDEELRLEQCHKILCQHPYLYPVALELSLRLPAEAAKDWLRSLAENYFVSINDVLREIDVFLVYRMDLTEGVPVCIEYANQQVDYFVFLDYYLRENTPLLAKKIFELKHKKQFSILLKIFRMFKKFIGIRSNEKVTIKRTKLNFLHLRYLSYDSPNNKKPLTVMQHFFVFFVQKIFTIKISSYPPPVFTKKQWYNLPEEFFTCLKTKDNFNYELEIVTVAWGEEYIQKLLYLNIKSLFALKNVPFISEYSKVTFVFYTTKKDSIYIKSSSEYLHILKFANIKFIYIEKIFSNIFYDVKISAFMAKYSVMMFAHRLHFKTTTADKRILFNFPDVVYQNDMLERFHSLIMEGKKFIFIYPGPYALYDKMLDALKNYFRDDRLEISNSELRQLICKHRHPYAELFYEKSALRYIGATLILRDVHDEGFIAHTTCITPTLATAISGTEGMYGTIDYSLPLGAKCKNDEIYLCTKNTDFCIASLNNLTSEDNSMRLGKFLGKNFQAELRSKMRLFNRIFFSIPICFYSGENLSKALWEKELAISTEKAKKLLTLNNKVFEIPAIEFFSCPNFFGELSKRRKGHDE